MLSPAAAPTALGSNWQCSSCPTRKPEELIARYGIDSKAIVAKVKSLVS
jgi:hypothetical protein